MGIKKKQGKIKKSKTWSPTVKQQKFIDCYEGNATDAARKAGYQGNDNVLAATASRLLRNVKVFEAIQKRLEKEKSALIADRTEREEILSGVARKGEKDKDRISAVDTLNKMDGLYVQKHELTGKDGGSLKMGITFSDGIKQVRDQMKSNPEEEERLLGEVIDE